MKRRKFLQSVGVGVPTLTVMLETATAQREATAPTSVENPSAKFTPLNLQSHFNASPIDFGPRDRAEGLSGGGAKDRLIRTPAGKQVFQGIPFLFGPAGLNERSWVVLSSRAGSHSSPSLQIPVARRASFICLVAFADWDENEFPPPDEDVVEKVGQHLADAVLTYDDGTKHVLPIRRRFEVEAPFTTWRWAKTPFAALPLRGNIPTKLTDSLPNGLHLWNLQYGYKPGPYPEPRDGGPVAMIWVSALANPEPSRAITSLVLEAAGDDSVVVCALTLFDGRENPLRWQRLSLYRLTLPEANAEDSSRWKFDVDLGVIARSYVLADFEPAAWLASNRKGLGERAEAIRGAQHIYLEIAAAPDATLTLQDAKSGKQYEFDLIQLVPGQQLDARPVGARIEVLEREKVWLHAQVADSATGRPTPVRLAFRSKDGRYIPPYGHRTEINDGTFQDYGADLKLGDSPFAYVDGRFEVELPVGEVYMEMSKGFEYEPVRQRLEIKPDQRECRLAISRFVDLRSKGWVTADVHVHFLPPTTAILEGQAEGVNLVNLLAAQWGDLFTNIADLPQKELASRDGETQVWLGTENRQQLLGHINLLGSLGSHGTPISPMSASGPEPSYLGDPVWSSMAEWADACREREGVVVSPHFPYPTGEIAADIALGKIDAVELYPWETPEHFNRSNYREWYRYLNCGYRLAVTGGTDKMSAMVPLGFNRTYAYLGQQEFTFGNWAQAVRKGATFATTGPLLSLQVDGHLLGDEILLGAGGGTLEVQAEAKCFAPIHRLDVVMNGRVVATREERAGAREIVLKEKVHMPGSGWLAARCYSREKPIRVSIDHAIAAHTSPVYVRVPGDELFSAPSATYLLTLIEGCQTWLENLAVRPDPDRLERMRRVLAEGHAELHRRLKDHASHHH